MRGPTERQAALAARQLLYHRERLHWMRDRMRDNEALLLLYLTHLDVDATTLPGGYQVAGCAPSAADVTVEKLALENRYEQLAIRIGERGIA